LGYEDDIVGLGMAKAEMAQSPDVMADIFLALFSQICG
jgi:hypothetical protein